MRRKEEEKRDEEEGGGRGWGMRPTLPLLACRVSPFAVSGRRHKLNDREGALKSEACRGKRIIYSPRSPRREQRRPRSLITAASDALIRDGKATAVSRADECAAFPVRAASAIVHSEGDS